jgi:hypothetical protein
MELDVKIQGQFSEVGLYDPGLELVCVSEVAAKDISLPFSTDVKHVGFQWWCSDDLQCH